MNNPKVFISYSWHPEENKIRVEQLARRLMSDGVDVTLDVWSLKDGQDKYVFMEKMVTDSDINKVLIICNRDYAEKADCRKGGVGTESTIMSDEIYSKADQTKFLPVVFEKDNDGMIYKPHFLKSRIHIDMSSDDCYEMGYDQLLRDIFDKPLIKKPALGCMPAYLDTDEPVFLSTAVEQRFLKVKNEASSSFKDGIERYFEKLIASLDQFRIGDIDIYLAGGRKRVMQYINKVCPNQVMRYHHVDFPVMKTAIEVHFTPSYMFFPIHNSRMQKWFKEVMDLQCSNVVTLPDGYGEITVPTMNFNVIYILSHLYRHVFTEGIGLRQLLDYYFVLVKWHTDLTNLTDSNKSLPQMTQINTDLDALRHELKYLGLWKFAQAVMFVMKEVFGLSEDRMIAPMDEREGRFLLDEIMRGGNFGQYDDRMGSKVGESKIHRYFRMNLRNLRFVKHYPTEALSEPLFRTWFAVWKKIHGIK